MKQPLKNSSKEVRSFWNPVEQQEVPAMKQYKGE